MADISHLLTYHPAIYNPRMLTKGPQKLTVQEMRAEYSRLRSVAIKRLDRMRDTKYKATNIYTYNRNKFIPLKEIKTESQIAHKLTEVVQFLSMETSTLSGLKRMEKKTVESLQKATPERKGYTNITIENLKEFGEFMEFARSMLADMEFDSNRVAMFFNELVDIPDSWRKKAALIRAYKDSRRADNKDGKNLSGMKSAEWMRKELGIATP